MKKSLITILATALSATAVADDLSFLTLERSDGTAVSLTAIGTELTFDGTNLVATNAATGQSATIALNDISVMYFAAKAVTTGISDTESTPHVAVRGGRIMVAAPAGAHVTVVTTAGAVIAEATVGGSSATPVSPALPRGIYIVKVNESATKVSVK
jgi:hypothetical protein